MNNYTVVSLFTGIGGIDLAFEWAGFEIVAQVEIDDFCNRILDLRWPGLLRRRDVRECNAGNLPRPDVLVGGFPCQPHSFAGARAGASDSRNLWPDFRRLIGDLRPRAVLLENVPGILTTMGTGILADLAALGYVGRTGIISASDAGAPHLRERWFCVAYDYRQRQQQPQGTVEEQRGRVGDSGSKLVLANQEHGHNGGYDTSAVSQHPETDLLGRQHRASQSRLGRGFNGLPARMDGPHHRWPAPQGVFQYDWEPSRIRESLPGDADRRKALGNAVVPQVVYPLAVAIREWLDQETERGQGSINSYR